MEELKPCPFCGSTNSYVYGYQHDAGLRWRVVCLDCMAMVDPGTEQQKYRAIEAWNRRAAPENKPLTLKEMQSIQEPTRLWIVDLWGEMIPHYELVGWEVLRACPLTKKLHCVSLDGGDDFIDLDSYGRTWLAYARKPEGSKP